MNADVTVDALPDRSFTAHVTEIGAMGENSGGNSKYSVELRLDRAPDMLDGMNASVVVHRGSRSALLIPSAAVSDRGSRSYVYTALDNKTPRVRQCIMNTICRRKTKPSPSGRRDSRHSRETDKNEKRESEMPQQETKAGISLCFRNNVKSAFGRGWEKRSEKRIAKVFCSML